MSLKKYKMVSMLIISLIFITGYAFSVGFLFNFIENNLFQTILQWIVLAFFLVVSCFLGRHFKKKGYFLWALFIWSLAALLVSVSLVSSVLPSIEQKCIGQWLKSFGLKPWTLSLGSITTHKEILLWSPGFLFAIFIGAITLLGYQVSRLAKDILLMRLTPKTLTTKIGEAMKMIQKEKDGDLDLIMAAPLIGNITDKKAYKNFIKPFWDWLLDKKKSKEQVHVRLICLTELAAAEFYKNLSADEEEIYTAYMKSEEYCKKLISCDHVKIDRRDNLPLTKMIVALSSKDSRGILFFTAFTDHRRKPKKIEIQGFETKDPAVIELLSRFFDNAYKTVEPITRIGAFVYEHEQ